MTKHNKLKNSGLLFELLVRQITTDTLNNKESKAVGILKKYYHNTDILKEYKIYNALASSKKLSEVKASMLIQDCVKSYSKLNKVNLRKQKYNLISEIKSNYSIEEFFKARVDNYKILASVYLLLEMESSDSLDQVKYSDCKITLLEHISNRKEEVKDEVLEEFSTYDSGTRSLVYEIMVKKFNEKYLGLNENQKEVLTQYIQNISTTDYLRTFCNSKITFIKEHLNTVISSEKDVVRKVKLEEVFHILAEIPDTKVVTENDINNILSYFELIKEAGIETK